MARNKDKHTGFHDTNSPFLISSYQAEGAGATTTDVVRMIGYTIAQLRGATPAELKRDRIDVTLPARSRGTFPPRP